MNAERASPVEGPERNWSTRKKIYVIVIVTAVIASFSMWSFYEFYLEEQRVTGFDSYVKISYTVSIACNSSDQYRVLCPLPVDSEGCVWPLTQGYLDVTGNSTASIAMTEYGEALELIGNGVTIITMNIRSTLTDPFENLTRYWHLSLMESNTELGFRANLYSDHEDVLFGLVFDYDFVYGNCGANFICDECIGSLNNGWNTLSVDHSGGVA